LSPVQHSREFDPLDSAFDPESNKKAVEVSFDGPLGDVKVPSDLRVVAALQQKIDDLPLASAHLVELIIHRTEHLPDAS
jgi:hypothetical protein